jgi:hypothetical protein
MGKRKGTLEEQAIRDRCNKIRSMLRRAWSKDPKRLQCLKDKRRKYVGPNKRQRYEHQCNICKKWWKQDEVQIDHVVPAGSFLELTPECLGNWAFRLFEGQLQKVCVDCHNKKSAEERRNK